MIEYQAKLADFLAKYEKKLPRPENYRKKATGVLWRTLRRIDEDMSILPDVQEFAAM